MLPATTTSPLTHSPSAPTPVEADSVEQHIERRRRHAPLYTTDGHYITPAPRSATDRQLWRLVIHLYRYDSEEALHRAADATPAPASSPARTAEGAQVPVAAATASGTSSSTGKQSAMPREDVSVVIEHVLRPLEAALMALQTAQQQQRGAASASAARQHSKGNSVCGGSSSSDNRGLTKASGSVLDVALQHPFPPLRHALVECLLNYLDVFNFAYCAPIAVCAASGDVQALRLLLRHGTPEAMDPNCGFPITTAVRHNQLAILRELLAVPGSRGGEAGNQRDSPSRSRPTAGGSMLAQLKPNYGNPFAEAVCRGNVAAAALLAAHDGVNVNRFANNRGTNPLLSACRAFIEAARRVTALETVLAQRGDSGGSKRGPTAPPTASSTIGGSMPVRRKTLSPTNSSAAVAGSPRRAATSAASAEHPTERCPFKHQLGEAVERLGRCREMVCLLLSLPDIDLNVGYFAAPLQLAAQYNCPELVELLLLHPKIRPNRVPRPTTALAQAYAALQHQTLSHEALQLLVAPPIERAVRNGGIEVFALLARHPKTVVGVVLLEELERDPRDLTRVPFLEELARWKPCGWEGWGWRWRQRCVYAGTLADTALSVLNIVLLTTYSQNTSSLCWALLVVYLLASPLTMVTTTWRRYRVPEALATALACLDGSAEVGAAVAHRLATLPLGSPCDDQSVHASNSINGVSAAAAAAVLTPSHRVQGGGGGGTASAAGSASLLSTGTPPTPVPASMSKSCNVVVALLHVVLSTSRLCRRCCCCLLWRCCGGTGNGKLAEDVTVGGSTRRNGGGGGGGHVHGDADGGGEEGREVSGLGSGSVVGLAMSTVLGFLLVLMPVVPLLELVVLWVFATYLKGDGAGSASAGPIADSPEALLRFLRGTFSPIQQRSGRAESVVLVSRGNANEDGHSSVSNAPTPAAMTKDHHHDVPMSARPRDDPVPARHRRSGTRRSFGNGRHDTSGGNEEPLDGEAAHDALTEEAGRKVFLHDGDGIGDNFPFHQRKLQRQQQQHGTSTDAAAVEPTVVVVGGGVGSDKLRRGVSPASPSPSHTSHSPPLPLRRNASTTFGNESFSYPRPATASAAATARRRLLDDGPLPPASPRAARKGKGGRPALTINTTSASTSSSPLENGSDARGNFYCNRYLRSFLTDGRSPTALRFSQPSPRENEAADGPNLYVRSFAYLSLELAAPWRLMVAIVSLFTHLVTLYPENRLSPTSTNTNAGNSPSTSNSSSSNPVKTSTGATVVAGLGLVACVLSMAIYTLMLLALKRTSPQSVLSGRRHFYVEDSASGSMDEYIL